MKVLNPRTGVIDYGTCCNAANLGLDACLYCTCCWPQWRCLFYHIIMNTPQTSHTTPRIAVPTQDSTKVILYRILEFTSWQLWGVVDVCIDHHVHCTAQQSTDTVFCKHANLSHQGRNLQSAAKSQMPIVCLSGAFNFYVNLTKIAKSHL